ncbi:MAG TPA: molybdopterin-dependent oxidoreductase [Thermoleophilia bacterium]|nr:molybdopterin-dependent oxidoreductase [Thermoleophilia bacterium]
MDRKLLNINGVPTIVMCEPSSKLADVLRRQLGLTGTKVACGQGQCGSCSVILNGKVVRSCSTTMKRVPAESEITTIEGIGRPDHLHPLQLAWIRHGGAQCGYCSPGFIVSSKALLDENPDPTREEVRDWWQKHANVCRCTGYRPLVDAVLDAAKVLRGELSEDELRYKVPGDGHIWNTRFPRPTAVAKVTGAIDYGADYEFKMPPDTLQCAIVHAQVSHANILSIDVSEAEKMPGVVKVVTHKDVKGRNRINGLVMFPEDTLADGWERPILCDSKVYQYGDAIAIVCADTIEQAKAAVDKVKVELEELPAYMDALDAMADDAIEIYPGTPNVYFHQPLVKGDDTGEIFAKAAHVVEGKYYLQRQPHLFFEPDCGFAYTDEEGRLTIHSKSIALYLHAAMIAEGLGVEEDKLRMVQNYSGGTFGYKFCPTLEALVGAAHLATGRPVYLKYDYWMSIAYTGKRSPFYFDCKLAADEEGHFLAMENEWWVDHGPYMEFGDNLTQRGLFCGAGYKIPNMRGMGHLVRTNHGWGAPFRAWGSPQCFFAGESIVDEMAKKLDMDPFELRYKNLVEPGDTFPWGQEHEVYVFQKLFDMAKPHYEEAKERCAEQSTSEVKKGVGVALGIYTAQADGQDVANAVAELRPDGGVRIYNTWEDHGQGSDGGTLGTAHEALRPLGVSMEQISLDMNDTGTSPDSGGAGGSRSQVMVGNAIKDACDKLVEAMKKDDGGFRTYDEMVAEGLSLRYEGSYTAEACTFIDPHTGQGKPNENYMYAVFIAEVSVEVATGKTYVDHLLIATDVGVINSRLNVDGQMWGGLAQGVALALREDFDDLTKHTSMRACGIPYPKDITDDLTVMYLETPRPTGPYGASGCGEVPLTASHAAIINAIDNACGARVRHLPALPEKVLRAMEEDVQAW